MRITRIDFEGRDGRYATAQRKRGSDWIEVAIITPQQPDGLDHVVDADCEEDIRSMAQCLQFHLEGGPGTNSDVQDYYRQLLMISDC